MAMTQAQLLAEIRLCIKRDTNGFADAYINTRIDWAIEDICLANDWSEMMKQYSFTISSGTTTYSFPTRMKSIYTIRLNSTTGAKLIYINARDFDSDWPKPSLLGSGEPTHYNDYGDRFEVLKTPDQDYTAYLKCSILAAALASSSSTPDIVRKDRLIVAQATVYCFEALQEPDLAMRWQGIANQAYARALDGDRKPLDWIPQARPFQAVSALRGETWKNPFVTK